MGILSRIFRRKKEEVPEPEEVPESTLGTVTVENVKAKMDLVLTRFEKINTQIDSLRVQNETLSERIKNIERLVTEIRSFCK